MKIKKGFAVALIFSLLFTACISFRNEVADRGSFNVISQAQEVEMGSEAYKEVLAKSTVSKNPTDLARVEAVSKRLIKVIGDDMPQADWQFTVIESKDINAFALPGGKVAIYTGLLHIINDDELAYVLGHEIAHVTCHHGSERLSQQLLIQLGAVALQSVLKTKSPKTTNAFLAAYGIGTQVGVSLPFSRKNELEADKIGLRYAVRAGYKAEAAITTLQKFEAIKGGAGGPELFSTHPNDSSRIEALEKEIAELKNN